MPEFSSIIHATFSSEKIGQPYIEGAVEWGDATLKDFRRIVDLYLTHPGSPCIVDPERHGHGDVEVWPALTLNCKVDMARFHLGPDKFIEPVYVSSACGLSDRFEAYIPHFLGLSWILEYASANRDIPGRLNDSKTDTGFLSIL